MSYSGLEFENSHRLAEREYSLLYEANVAALLTTGNGYMGVRASLEEYGSLGIQGFWIRGVMDEVVEVRLTMCDNMYMKKYYVEEDRLKRFERQERAVNLLDFLLVRFEIGGETFYPWEGKVLSWKRYLDLSDGVLHREVVWENTEGLRTRFDFRRFASFADDHTYCMQVEMEPLNYSEAVTILSGMDLRTKSNGQIPQRTLKVQHEGRTIMQEEIVGPKYGFHSATGISQSFSQSNAVWEDVCEDGIAAQRITFDAVQGEVYTLEKLIATVTGRDTRRKLSDCIEEYFEAYQKSSYQEEYEKHCAVYQKLFSKLEIGIEGDDTADRAIRFSNYHTLISIERNDHVHSFSAKGLTGEMYNNFVWWDAEIFQAPVFQQTMPEYSRNSLLFRYSHLKEARELAVKEGCRGARYPFTTGVTGEETVWTDVRHPFMQIHCVSDVGLSVINYLTATGDMEFVKQYGMEILLEICRYWVSRVVWKEEKNRYEILQVTGTDEHHPYVDNNAYTNYSVYRVLSAACRLLDEYGSELDELKKKIGFKAGEKGEFEHVAEHIYLPLDEDTGMIPQFDGYFDLSRELEVQGGSKSGYTQMKQAGLYNKSQVIKQPDVLMLFAYQNIDMPEIIYRRNLDYYQARCEAASSLSYCVHSICYADMDMPESAYGYLMETAEMDLKNKHGGTQDGIHSGCAAGAWMAVVRGVAGMKMTPDRVVFAPHYIPWWKQVSFHCVWHGQGYSVILNNRGIQVTADEENTGELVLSIYEKEYVLKAGETAEYEFSKAASIRG
ncbi:MAG: hypothetical protein Q4C91_04625 [Eubacteriales bacterium]|nr:hypothetical protein [Eubacteriales bacterium]